VIQLSVLTYLENLVKCICLRVIKHTQSSIDAAQYKSTINIDIDFMRLKLLVLFVQSEDGFHTVAPTPALYIYETVELELSLSTISIETDESLTDYFSCPLRLCRGTALLSPYFLHVTLTLPLFS